MLTFSGWTNIDRGIVPKGTVYAAFEPCALLTVTNLNTSKQIEFFSAVSVESFKDGRWIEVARATQLPWLIAGTGPVPGAASQVPVRILEELPKENSWRVQVKYNLTPPKALKFVDDWWRRLTPFKRGIFVPQDHVVTSSMIPAPREQGMIDSTTPARSSEADKARSE